MRIISVYVEGFGRLKNKAYDFGKGLNTVFLDNGEGKTTLAAFIKAMFYGLENTRSGKIEENSYLKYKPFEGGALGGSLTFEKDGRQYRIERFFDVNKNGKEDFKLYCGGALSNDYSAKIGEEIFRLDGGGFEKSVYLPQKEVDRRVNDSITARLSSLIEQREDKFSCEDALRLLDAKRREYKLEKGKGGKIFSQEGEIFRLEGELVQSRESKAKTLSISFSQREIEQRLQAAAKEIKTLEEKISEINLTEHKKCLKEDYERLLRECEEIKSLQEKFLKNHGSPEDVAKLIDRVRYLKNAFEELKGKEKEKEETSSYTNQQNKSAQKKTMALCLPMWALSVILIFGGVFTISGNAALGAALLVLGFIALLTGAFRYIFYKISLKTQGGAAGEAKDSYESQMLQIKEELREIELRYGDLTLLWQAAERYREREIVLAQKRENMQSIVNNPDFDASFKPNSFTAKDLEMAKADKKQEERKLLSDYNSLERQLESERQNAQREGDILLSLKEAKEKLAEYKKEYEAVKSAMFFLDKARENLKRAYLPQMNESFKKYVKYFRNPLELSLDKELEIKLTQGGKIQSGEHLSQGYLDLADFCCRLSLAQALSRDEGGEKLLILDDPFVNFDDGNMLLAKELVKNLAKEYQIIYFTCHTSRII